MGSGILCGKTLAESPSPEAARPASANTSEGTATGGRVSVALASTASERPGTADAVEVTEATVGPGLSAPGAAAESVAGPLDVSPSLVDECELMLNGTMFTSDKRLPASAMLPALPLPAALAAELSGTAPLVALCATVLDVVVEIGAAAERVEDSASDASRSGGAAEGDVPGVDALTPPPVAAAASDVEFAGAPGADAGVEVVGPEGATAAPVVPAGGCAVVPVVPDGLALPAGWLEDPGAGRTAPVADVVAPPLAADTVPAEPLPGRPPGA